MLKVVTLSCLLTAGSGSFDVPKDWGITGVEMRGNDCSHTIQCDEEDDFGIQMCTALAVMCHPTPFSTRIVLESAPSHSEIPIPEGCKNPNVIDVKEVEEDEQTRLSVP